MRFEYYWLGGPQSLRSAIADTTALTEAGEYVCTLSASHTCFSREYVSRIHTHMCRSHRVVCERAWLTRVDILGRYRCDTHETPDRLCSWVNHVTWRRDRASSLSPPTTMYLPTPVREQNVPFRQNVVRGSRPPCRERRPDIGKVTPLHHCKSGVNPWWSKHEQYESPRPCPLIFCLHPQEDRGKYTYIRAARRYNTLRYNGEHKNDTRGGVLNPPPPIKHHREGTQPPPNLILKQIQSRKNFKGKLLFLRTHTICLHNSI